jgi:hypothetical protein
MKKASLVLSIALATAPAAHATTLTFDNLSGFEDLSTVSPYNGFNFTNFLAWSGGTTGNYPNGVVSSPNFIFSGGQINPSSPTDIVGTIAANSGTFTFNSAYMTYAWLPGLQVDVVGLNGATVVDSQIITLSNAAATQFVFNWANLTSLTFTGVPGTGTSDPFSCGSFNCTQFTIDNFSVSTVPEPSAWAMMLLGFAGLGYAAYRRRSAFA